MMLAVLIPFTLLAIIFMPFVLHLLAPDFRVRMAALILPSR